MSPISASFHPLAQQTRLCGLTLSMTTCVIRSVSNCPHPSLNTTHCTMLGWFSKASMMRTASSSKFCLAKASCPAGRLGLGRSCHTNIPSRSQCMYQRDGSTLMCLRIMLKPSSFIALMSNRRASSLGAVYSPSGHQPWSNGPIWKICVSFRKMRGVPSTFFTSILRMPQ